ncbi:unnamed protein product, partial [marine sediment metagenome]
VDETETFSVMMDVDQGNESDFGEWEDRAIGVYHMNGTNQLFDESIYNSDGVTNGNPTVDTDGIIGKAIDFDGAGDFFNIGDSQPAFDNLTILAWVKISGDSDNCIVCKTDTTLTDGEFEFSYGLVEDEFRINYNDGSGWVGGPHTGTDSVELDTWYFVAVTFDSIDMNIYLDGELKATDSAPTSDLASNSVDVYIGARVRDATSYVLNGFLDEVRIYNRTLSTDEIKAIYENTVGTQ